MTSKFHIFAAVIAGVIFCSVAGAQVRTGEPATRQVPAPARAATRAPSSPAAPAEATGTRSGQAPRVIQVSPSGRVTPFFASGENSVNLDTISGVPGLGFDYPHLAAINGALGNNPSFQSGRHGRRGQGAFVPILYGGYPYSYDDSEYDPSQQPAVQQTQPQPQIIVIQQSVPAQQSADAGNDSGNFSAPAPAPQADAQIPDVGDFILVRRDGRVLFASVFSVVGTQLQYVSPEGIRHTLAMSDLDAGATQEMNEARGTTVQIHN